MIECRGFRFKLCVETGSETDNLLRRFAGSARFAWNKVLAEQRELLDNGQYILSYNSLCKLLPKWKNAPETAWLKDNCHSQVLQQKFKDLSEAFKRWHEHLSGKPKFKRREEDDSIRFPQGFEIDEANRRIRLPKIGWIRYFKSRGLRGTSTNITVSRYRDAWYATIQVKFEATQPQPPSNTAVGIDMGVAKFAAYSDNTWTDPVNALQKYEEKLARLQRKLAKKTKHSKNFVKLARRIAKLHGKIADIRNDFLHKISTDISENQAVVVMEDLRVINMTKSAKGTVEKPGRNVAAKSGLNKSILDQGWGTFRTQLKYKMREHGGVLVTVPPQYTSQTCSACGSCHPENRVNQSKFKCVDCGHEENADVNAAKNILQRGMEMLRIAIPDIRNVTREQILAAQFMVAVIEAERVLKRRVCKEKEKAAGHAVTACGAGRAQAPAKKQEPVPTVRREHLAEAS